MPCRLQELRRNFWLREWGKKKHNWQLSSMFLENYPCCWRLSTYTWWSIRSRERWSWMAFLCFKLDVAQHSYSVQLRIFCLLTLMEAILVPTAVYCHLMFIKIICEKRHRHKIWNMMAKLQIKWIHNLIWPTYQNRSSIFLPCHIVSNDNRKCPHHPSVLSKPVFLYIDIWGKSMTLILMFVLPHELMVLHVHKFDMLDLISITCICKLFAINSENSHRILGTFQWTIISSQSICN